MLMDDTIQRLPAKNLKILKILFSFFVIYSKRIFMHLHTHAIEIVIFHVICRTFLLCVLVHTTRARWFVNRCFFFRSHSVEDYILCYLVLMTHWYIAMQRNACKRMYCHFSTHYTNVIFDCFTDTEPIKFVSIGSKLGTVNSNIVYKWTCQRDICLHISLYFIAHPNPVSNLAEIMFFFFIDNLVTFICVIVLPCQRFFIHSNISISNGPNENEPYVHWQQIVLQWKINNNKRKA